MSRGEAGGRAMNVLDIVLAVPMVWLLYKGWRRGAVREAATLAGVVPGVWAAGHLSQQVAEWLSFDNETSVLAAFFICFVGAMVLTHLLGRMIEGLLKAAHIGVANRIAGALAGLLKALCVLAVLLNYAVMLDHHGALLTEQVRTESVLYQPVYHTGNWLTESLKEFIASHRDEWGKELRR